MLSIEQVNTVVSEADCLYTNSDVQQALDKLAQQITDDFKDKNPVFLCVLTGAIIPLGHLLTRLNFPCELDYIHATRYDGDVAGGTIKWIAKPRIDLTNRCVIVFDDILDEGHTLKAIMDDLEQKNAQVVTSAVLVNKLHDRKAGIKANYVGLDVEDRYLFGYGMDYKGHLRHAAGIFAVKGM